MKLIVLNRSLRGYKVNPNENSLLDLPKVSKRAELTLKISVER